MRKFLLLAVLWCSMVSVQARQVPAEKAQAAAQNFIKSLGGGMGSRSSLPLQLVYQETSKASMANARAAATTYYYVYNVGQGQGMIFVSGDDKVVPILGYTDAGSYDPRQLPPHFIKWLEYYKNEIRYAIENLPEEAGNQQAWESLLRGEATAAGKVAALNAVAPLVATKWDQSPFYNQLCPFDSQANERTVTGCVATAMAQIMRYWEYPAKGSGFHSYNHESYGTLSANFSNTTYDWANMPLQLNGNNTAVATLMQQLGVSVDMNYDVAARGGSGAYVISSASPVQHCSEYALKTYFGYAEAKGVQRDNYSLTNWISLLKQQLDAGQPILYAGFGSGGGHAFVCDGYNSSGYFHINWGWGGYADGYFAITALNPDGVGTGGGTGGFNSGHQAVIDIKAPSAPAQSPSLELYADLALSTEQIYFTQGFSLGTDIINKGNTTFKGDYAAVAFDAAGNFVDFIETHTGNELPAGYHYEGGLGFATEGMLSLLPGIYTLAVFYKTTAGEWQQLQGSGYTGSVQLEVIYPNSLELASPFSVNGGGELYSNKAVSVSLKLNNQTSTPFQGAVSLDLYKLDGTFAHSIETKENVAVCASCTTADITFSNSVLDLEPGTYLLAAIFQTNDQWDLAGSSYYTNPSKVVVKVAPLAADAYENNNEPALAYLLPQEFASTEKKLITSGASIHEGTDYDFYSLGLPADGSYSITLRVHDAYNSGDGNTYSNDVLFSYSTDGESWSDAYDDVMPAALELAGGSRLYIFVASYFQGETGSYALQTTARKLQPNAVDESSFSARLELYPNPSSNLVNVKSDKVLDSVELLSLSGQVLRQQKGPLTQLDLTTLPKGMYLLRLRSGSELAVKKIIKQ